MQLHEPAIVRPLLLISEPSWYQDPVEVGYNMMLFPPEQVVVSSTIFAETHTFIKGAEV